MYAVIETGGKQYKVSNGDTIYVEKLDAAEESTVDFKVVAVSTDDGFKVGTPYVEVQRYQVRFLKMVRARRLLSLLISLKRRKTQNGPQTALHKGTNRSYRSIMINAEFFSLPTGELIGYRIKGHSDMAESGQDILCAFVLVTAIYLPLILFLRSLRQSRYL